ncbi:ABC transporter substrate-binding protein [Parvularcula sp. LCG005]|uniref:ABC transporter substrate-binding protein n=1 Tax=Parvularcula sp. LCG005 TaxID=3078805 RepID=UPI002943F460|nr:ABC transporter substrate-binding protein [Parvularcula sp. LCG005]WOI52961.1 ABC transporter substrate-binding protein [Parvularcula sp. LCG005]
MIPRTALLALFALVGCNASPVKTDGQPRVVSLDYCADQYVLGLVERDYIAALSRDSQADYAYLRAEAVGLAQTSGRAEAVLALRPTVIVRTYGGGPDAGALYARLGIPVVQIGYAGRLEDIASVVQAAAGDFDGAMGDETASNRAAILIDQMRNNLDRVPASSDRRSLLYMTQGGVTAGPGTMIDDIITKAGYSNFETRPGWSPLPLERLAYKQPDQIATAFFDGAYTVLSPWTASRHPVARRQLANQDAVAIDSALTSCSAWYTAEAVTVLAERRSQ